MFSTSALLVSARSLIARVGEIDPQGSDSADEDLLMTTAAIEEVGRELDVLRARRAAEIARRSRRELGDSGLAARRGHVSGASLVRSVTQAEVAEVNRRIRVGGVLNEAAARTAMGGVGDLRRTAPDDMSHRSGMEDDTATSTAGVAQGAGEGRGAEDDYDGATPGRDGGDSIAPLDAIAHALWSGSVGVDAADQIIKALEPIADTVDPVELSAAAHVLIDEGAGRHADEIGKMARGLRDTLDRVGVADREEMLRSRRALRKSRVRDGLRYVSLVLDPESDARLIGALDQAMSPRLGGPRSGRPRFSDPASISAIEQLIDDPRSNEQLQLDILVDLVTIGSQADPGAILGASAPGVRVTMSAHELVEAVVAHDPHDTRCRPATADVVSETICEHSATTGVAMVEGHPELVSAATARRFLCNQGAIPIVLGGDGQPLDVGRTRRLFTTAQRVALSVRDGGCRWPGCERPPSWCESHHITEYQHGGNTNLRDGVLLCRRHHMILHHNKWHIEHDSQHEPHFFLRPPAAVDPARELIPMTPARPPLHSPADQVKAPRGPRAAHL